MWSSKCGPQSSRSSSSSAWEPVRSAEAQAPLQATESDALVGRPETCALTSPPRGCSCPLAFGSHCLRETRWGEWVFVPWGERRGVGLTQSISSRDAEGLALAAEAGEGPQPIAMERPPRPTHPASQNHLVGLYAHPLGGQQERWLLDGPAFLLRRQPRTGTRRGLGVRNGG